MIKGEDKTIKPWLSNANLTDKVASIFLDINNKNWSKSSFPYFNTWSRRKISCNHSFNVHYAGNSPPSSLEISKKDLNINYVAEQVNNKLSKTRLPKIYDKIIILYKLELKHSQKLMFVDSQSTALIHKATSAPTPSFSLYLLSDPFSAYMTKRIQLLAITKFN